MDLIGMGLSVLGGLSMAVGVVGLLLCSNPESSASNIWAILLVSGVGMQIVGQWFSGDYPASAYRPTATTPRPRSLWTWLIALGIVSGMKKDL